MPVPLPTLPGVYYGYVWMTYIGRKTGSVFTFKAQIPPTDSANDALYAQYVADGLVSSWNTNMLPRYPNAVEGTDSRVYPLGHPTLPPAFSHASAAGAGGVSAAAAPAAAVIKHSVMRRGRGSQSHTAISPLQPSELTIDGTSVTDAFITNVNSDFGDFIAGVQSAFETATGGALIDYVQLSRKGAGATYPITGSFVEKLVGTERSRTARP
jgi:hypothetical protein